MFEKKRGKRFLASVMALVMLLSLAPVGALAAGSEEETDVSISWTKSTEAVQGGIANNLGDCLNLETNVSNSNDVWNSQDGNGAIYNLGSNSVQRFRGTFTIPNGYSAASSFKLYSAKQEVYREHGCRYEGIIPINDNIYVFVYPEGTTITAQNASNYLAFYGGNSCADDFLGTTSLAAGSGRYGQDSNYLGQLGQVNETLWNDMRSTDGWFIQADLDNIGKKITELIASGSASAGATFVIDVFAENNSTDDGGGLDRLVLSASNPATAKVVVRYYKDSVTPDNNIKTEVVGTGKLANDTVYIDVDANKPEHYQSGVLQNNMQLSDGKYTVTDGDVNQGIKYIDVLYTPIMYSVTYTDGVENEDVFENQVFSNQAYGTTTPTFNGTLNRTGYTFAGWSPELQPTVTQNVTYVARWEPVVYYTVIFNANGGAWSSGVAGYDMQQDTGANTYVAAQKSNLTKEDAFSLLDGTGLSQDGKRFVGWGAEQTQSNQYLLSQLSTVGQLVNVMTNASYLTSDNTITLYAIWEDVSADQRTYTVHQHFMKDASHEDGAINYYTTSQVASVGTPISSLIPDGLTNKNIRYEFGYSEYLYGEAKIGTTPYKGTETLQANNTAIHLYYYLDEVGETSKENPNGGPDNIPDAWQYKVTFKVVNGKWNDQTSADVVAYVTNKDKDGNPCAKDTADSKATLDGVTIPEAGSQPNSGYTSSGSWKPTPSTGLEIEEDTVFTYTYEQKSGGGGGGGSNRPKPPVVEIPDDVPTGLNGKDHYAYIIGYGNNDVRPQNNITRAEVATIFFRLLTDETREANMTKSNSYNDVKDGDWFCCAVSTLSKMGIIKGYEDGSFKPNDPISRAEFAAIAARFDPDGDKTPASFADVTSHWAKDEISIAANHGWIKGYEDGSFKPDQKITRAETMTLVNRVLNRLPEAKDDLHKDMKTWVDNMDETAWYYLAVQEATNSHYFKNKTSTKFEQWTDLRDTRDWSELEK